jgi:hypothetical protein
VGLFCFHNHYIYRGNETVNVAVTKGQTDMPMYQAVYGKGKYKSPITSVFADNEKAAKKEIRRQLDKPGRDAYLAAWEKDGEQIRLKGE